MQSGKSGMDFCLAVLNKLEWVYSSLLHVFFFILYEENSYPIDLMWELKIMHSKYLAECLSLYVLRIYNSNDKSQRWAISQCNRQYWKEMNEIMLIRNDGETDEPTKV